MSDWKSDFDPNFNPDLTPKEMLELGVFGGRYFTSLEEIKEFPKSWFGNAKINFDKKDKDLNYFKVNASKPLKYWQKKGWISVYDPKGWFQWYCRYFLGRRIIVEDERQIKRWKAMTRHIAQVQKYCIKGDLSCRPRQRQALLHWGYDARGI